MKYWIMIKNNIRKSKVTGIILVLLVCLASILLIASTSVLGSTDTILQDITDRTNISRFTTLQPAVLEESVDRIMDTMEEITKYEKSSILYFDNASIQDLSLDEEEQSIPIIYSVVDQDATISTFEPVLESGEKHENGIYLSYYLHVAEGYQLNDTIEIMAEERTYQYVVDGFYFDLNYCSPSILSVYNVKVSQENYQKVYRDAPEMTHFLQYLSLAKEGVTPNDMEIEFVDRITAVNQSTPKSGYFMNLDSVSIGTTIFAKILMCVLLGFSAILVVIAVVVIRFAILTYIEQNYKNLGVMEAAGYTSRNLIAALTLQFSLIVLIGAILGGALSYTAKPMVENLLAIASGMKWEILYQPSLMILEILILTAVVAAITIVLSLRIRRITVLEALRDGIATHNFKRTFFPLERTHLPLNLAIGTKNLFQERKKNASIGFIVAILCASMVLSFTMYYNFRAQGDNDVLWDFIGIEQSDIIVMTNDTDKVDMVLDMEGVTGCKSLSIKSGEIGVGDDKVLVQIRVSDDYEDFSKGVLYEGRFPLYDNEICLTTLVAEQLNVGINDTVTLDVDEKEAQFLVVGISQQITNLGMSGSITLDGIHRMLDTFEIDSYYVLLDSAVETETFITNAYETVGHTDVEILNYRKLLEGIMTSYESSMAILSVVSFVINLVIICLVLFLLIRTKVMRDNRKNGIYKAMGYTTGQLMLQTITSFVPTIILGCVIGVTIGILGSNTIIAAMMSFAGIKKCYLEIPTVLSIWAAVGLVVASILISVLSSLGIRKVTPSQMFFE